VRPLIRAIALVAVTAAGGRLSGAQQISAVFRAGVELVTVDVLVLDKSGNPVPDVRPEEFAVLAGRKARTIVTAEYIPARANRATTAATLRAAPIARPPGPTTNTRLAPGRTFLFVVDVDEIRPNEGRIALSSISDYLDRLNPDDRVGVVVLPQGTIRLDVTTDRAVIKAAMAKITGASNRTRSCEMTPGEAVAVRLGDTEGAKAYSERTTGLRCPSGRLATPEQLADQALGRYRQHAQIVFANLATLSGAMAGIEGPKALVFVSEGMLTDTVTRDALARFSAAAERARVSLYALHLDVPRLEASTSGGDMLRSRSLDDQVGFAGMAEAADAARGTALRVMDKATDALGQIDAELSGYYLLSFARDESDRDGERQAITVKVNRSNLDVRARAEFTPGLDKAAASARATADPKTSMADLLRWPVPVGEIGLDVDTHAIPVLGSPIDVRVFVTAEIAHGRGAVTALGYQVVDDAGKSVADRFEAPPALRPAGDGRSAYGISIPLAPGHYQLRLGVLDRDGKRGSVTHAFEVPRWPATGLRVGDLMFGEASTEAFRPIARGVPGAGHLTFRFEAQADSPDAFRTVTATLRVVKMGESTPLDEYSLPLSETADPRRRVTTAELDLAGYGAGEYVVTVILETPGGEIARRSRVFRR
jgi:VWFA-related protein